VSRANPFYIICDMDNNIAHLLGVSLFGRSCAMFAVFVNEDDALEVLYEIEKAGLLTRPHKVSRETEATLA
jgi:hypothetical protein